MSTGYKIAVNDGVYFLTFQIVGWVDIFTRKIYRDIAIESLEYCCENKGLQIFAWVIMSNHIHLLARSGSISLSDTIRDFKNYTSRKFLEYVNSENES
jgi:REP element-mobilizing transposase RayT